MHAFHVHAHIDLPAFLDRRAGVDAADDVIVAIGAGETTGYAGFSCFLVWIVKSIIIKIGGAEAYRKWRYFFVGMMGGYVTALGVSHIVDLIWFPGHGHKIHVW